MTITIEAQIKIIEREIAMRAAVYPKRVAEKKMKQVDADYQLNGMRDVLETIKKGRADEAELIRNTRASVIASMRGAIERYDMPSGWKASALDAIKDVRA